MQPGSGGGTKVQYSIKEMQVAAVPAQPAMQVATPMTAMMVACPPGAAPGTMIMVQTPSGQSMQVAVPAGVTEGTQFQVMVPSAAAPPARSQDEAAALFKNLPAVETTMKGPGDHVEDWEILSSMGSTQSTWQNPFGINTATRGAFPIKKVTAEGEVGEDFGSFYVASADRYNGDMQAAVLLPDASQLAGWGRSKRPTMVQSGDTVLPVSVFGAPFGQLETNNWGMKPLYRDANGVTTSVESRGCNQPQCYYIIGAFCCFFPTCGLLSCYLACQAQKIPGLFDVKRSDTGETVGLLKMWAMNSGMSSNSRIRVEFAEGVDDKTKLNMTLASLFMVADVYTSPPSSSGSGDAGGGFSGAPANVEMER